MDRWISPVLVRSALALVLMGTLAACGNLTAGGVGEAAVAMSGDAPDEGASPQMAVVDGPASTDHDDDDPEGELEADLTVFLVSSGGETLTLTDGEVRVRVDLQGVDEPTIGSRVVAAGTYTSLRIVFTEIEVEVDAGLVIGGVEIVGPIDVEFEGVLTVDRAIDVTIDDGESAELLIDLNAESWLQAVDPLTLAVDAEVVADLVAVRQR